MQGFKEDWKRILSVFFSWRGLVTLGIVGAFFVLTLVQKNEDTKNVLIFVTGLGATLLGGVWSYEWGQISGQGTIATRARLSIRGLTVLLTHLGSLQARVKAFADRHDGSGHRNELVATWLEEVDSRCSDLIDLTLTSIENWVDVVPDADVRTIVTEYRDAQSDVAKAERHVAELRCELEAMQEKTKRDEQQVAGLRAELEASHDAEEEAAKASARIAELQTRLGELQEKTRQDEQKIASLQTQLEASQTEAARAEAKLRQKERTISQGALSGISGSTPILGVASSPLKYPPNSILGSQYAAMPSPLSTDVVCNRCYTPFSSALHRVITAPGRVRCPCCDNEQAH